MLPYLRSWLGTGEAAPPTQQKKKKAPSLDAEALLRAQRMQLAQLRDEEVEVQADLDQATRERNQAQMRAKLTRLRQLQADIRLTEGKLNNVGAQRRLLQSADANVQQGALMGAGADQLDALVREADEIDLDEIVDRLQEGAARTHEFSSRLSEPLLYDDGGGGDIDEEVQELMQRAEDERLAGLLDAPATVAPPPSASSRPVRQPQGMPQ
jgi:hypothetical protein